MSHHAPTQAGPSGAAIARLDAPYDRAAALPPALRRPGLTTSVGQTARRLDDLARWHAALRAGRLPETDADFGDPQAVAPLREVVRAAGLPAVCGRQPARIEPALVALLWHLDRIVDLQPRHDRGAAIARVADELAAEWAREHGDWETALALLPDLGVVEALQWDRLRGRLRSRAWQEAQRVQRHLARRPEIVALIRRLGRAERAPDVAPSPLPVADDRRAPPVGVRGVETRLPGLPGEVRGIRFGGRLDGMLASEAVMLRHPVLKKLWRARHAEARLLSYDTDALLGDRRADPTARPSAAVADAGPAARERGPILLCLDTSGSMRGAPETLAKAVALEVLRTAQRERRGCVLIAFGGDGEVAEQSLAPTTAGIEALLDLMGRSFDGGTDLQAPVERAVRRVHEAGWHAADLLLVSDGEFGCVPATLERLDDARARLGLRVQGVLVGDRETMGLLEVCDDIHWVRDWRRDGAPPAAGPVTATGGAGGFSPVHSRSLTALYFPNALSSRAARHHAAGAAAASHAPATEPPRRPADVQRWAAPCDAPAAGAGAADEPARTPR